MLKSFSRYMIPSLGKARVKPSTRVFAINTVLQAGREPISCFKSLGVQHRPVDDCETSGLDGNRPLCYPMEAAALGRHLLLP